MRDTAVRDRKSPDRPARIHSDEIARDLQTHSTFRAKPDLDQSGPAISRVGNLAVAKGRPKEPVDGPSRRPTKFPNVKPERRMTEGKPKALSPHNVTQSYATSNRVALHKPTLREFSCTLAYFIIGFGGPRPIVSHRDEPPETGKVRRGRQDDLRREKQ